VSVLFARFGSGVAEVIVTLVVEVAVNTALPTAKNGVVHVLATQLQPAGGVIEPVSVNVIDAFTALSGPLLLAVTVERFVIATARSALVVAMAVLFDVSLSDGDETDAVFVTAMPVVSS
jgi:hypothetical protein